MKKLYLFLLCVSVVSVFCLSQANAIDPNTDPNLVAWYKLDDDANNKIVVNFIDPNHNGTSVRDTCDVAVAGKIGGALAFNGVLGPTGDYVAANQSLQNTFQGSFTISVLAREANRPTTIHFILGCSKMSGEEGPVSYIQIYVSNDGKIHAVIQSNNHTTSASETTASFPVGESDWKHIMAVFDYDPIAVATTVSLYVNAILTAQHTTSGVILPDYANTTNLCIGAYNDMADCGISFNFKGSLDDVRIYSGALSADVIAQLYLTGLGIYLDPNNVRMGVVYTINNINLTGTLDLPDVNKVQKGIVFDSNSRTGTLVKPAKSKTSNPGRFSIFK